MSEFATNLKLLIDMIEKKKNNLEQILNITLNQRELIGNKETRELFLEMNLEKQNLIDEILALDNVFQRKFDLIAHNFQNKVVTKNYREEVLLLQDHTKSVLRLDNDIRVQEEKNTKKINELKEKGNLQVQINKNKTREILDMYKSNNR